MYRPRNFKIRINNVFFSSLFHESRLHVVSESLGRRRQAGLTRRLPCGMKFSRISRVFQWSAKIRSRKNKLLRKKIPRKFTLTIYLECWISIKLIANNIISTVRKIPDRNLSEIRESLFPAIKCEIQKFAENLFPRNAKSRQSAKLNSRENFMPHGVCLNPKRLCW